MRECWLLCSLEFFLKKKFIEVKNLLPDFFEDIWDEESQFMDITNNQKKSDSRRCNFSTSNSVVDEDGKSGLITLSISWKDPEVAADWANDLVKQLNDQLRDQAIADSKKRVGYLEQGTSQDHFTGYACRSIQPARIREAKSHAGQCKRGLCFGSDRSCCSPKNSEKPNRKLIVALGGVCGGFLGIFVVFFAQFLKN